MGQGRIDKALSALWHLENMKSVREVFTPFVLNRARVDA